jgi:hypothetical protein
MDSFAEGVASANQAIIAKLRFAICFDHLEKAHCDHAACWEFMRMIDSLDPERHFNYKPVGAVGQAIDLYADPNLVWSDDLEQIRQPLVDLMLYCVQSGTAFRKLRLLAQAMLPNFDVHPKVG